MISILLAILDILLFVAWFKQHVRKVAASIGAQIEQFGANKTFDGWYPDSIGHV